ncbi:MULTISPECIES: 2-oxoacid:acceptor oxidoreductase family protein [unclassified Nocardioides]|uniref:2-oxoacid:acceptor oxidoreductase family protein n=1 Tax=unclassified Nocardioides TaxID=2615069 RepID=UPI00361A20D2
MFDVRFHGRGGQGVVTAAEMLSVAAFDSGLHAQAIPTFGSERTGAPVTSFCRISQTPIRFHEPVDHPDAIVVQDPTLLHVVPVLDGARPTTYVLINSSRAVDDLHLSPVADGAASGRVVTFAGGDLARAVLGRPLPNTALLGALCALTCVVSLEALTEAIRQRFASTIAEDNIEVAARAHAAMTTQLGYREMSGRA